MELDIYKLDFKNLQNYAEKLSNYAENSTVQYQFSLSRKKIYISHCIYSFADSNGQNLDICIRNRQLKFQGDLTVNESGMETLLKYVCRKYPLKFE